MRLRIKVLVLLAAAISLASGAGCSFSVPQYEAAREILSSTRGGPDPMSAFAWRLSWNDRSARVYAIQTSEGLYFAANDTPAVFYDGSFVRRAVALLPQGREVTIEVDESGRRMTFFEAGGLVLDTPCAAWTSRSVDEGTLWEKRCDGLRTPLSKLVAVSGEIIRIEAPVHPGYPPLVLTHEPDAPRASE